MRHSLLIYVAIGLTGVAFVVGAIRAARRSADVRWPTPLELVIGFVTDFFRYLGDRLVRAHHGDLQIAPHCSG